MGAFLTAVGLAIGAWLLYRKWTGRLNTVSGIVKSLQEKRPAKSRTGQVDTLEKDPKTGVYKVKRGE